MDWLAYRAHTQDCPPTAKGPIDRHITSMPPNKKKLSNGSNGGRNVPHGCVLKCTVRMCGSAK